MCIVYIYIYIRIHTCSGVPSKRSITRTSDTRSAGLTSDGSGQSLKRVNAKSCVCPTFLNATHRRQNLLLRLSCTYLHAICICSFQTTRNSLFLYLRLHDAAHPDAICRDAMTFTSHQLQSHKTKY